MFITKAKSKCVPKTIPSSALSSMPSPLSKVRISVVAAAVVFATACAAPSPDESTTVSKQAKSQEVAEEKQHKVPHRVPHKVIEKRKEIASQKEIERVQVAGQRVSGNKMAKMVMADISAYTSHANKAEISIHRPITPVYDQFMTPPVNTENYQSPEINGVKMVTVEPVSTFSIDVDTGSYTNARRMLTQGTMPPADAIRIEEFINYFDYNYPQPKSIEQPFSVNTALSTAPWNEQRHLLRIALKGYQPDMSDSKGSNLVFLLDVSGSMNQANKLPLLKRSLMMLSNQLNDNDKVSIVVYAGASGVVLEPTDGNNKSAINNALEKLQAGGSTNGAAGIKQAYQLAEKAFIEGGVNRVILATDGDFNVGMVDHKALIDLIKKEKDKGIALTTLGFGQGNYNDHLMEQLADAGNGNYAYIDNINEARKVLVDELQSNMQIIAKDVKIQVEFNPSTVAEYRLIGYENRKLANEDFNNDKIDAGDIGAGHRVTALYEISLVNSQSKFNDDLRYSKSANTKIAQNINASDELAYVKLRYKQPNQDNSQLLEAKVTFGQASSFAEQSDDFKFATAVASFAQRMKSSKFTDSIDYQWIASTAQQAKGRDEFGYRSEFIQLVRNAGELSTNGNVIESTN